MTDSGRPIRRLDALSGPVLMMVLAVLGPVCALQAVYLQGEIVRVGYPGSGSDVFSSIGDVYRVGRWTPVVVRLANRDADRFEGRIEVRQTDADGDQVFARRDVVVQGSRPFWLYVPGGPRQEDTFMRGSGYQGPAPFTVRVFDRQGRLAELFDDEQQPIKELKPPQEVIAAPPDALLILDISERPVGQLNRLKDLEGLQNFMRTRCMPRELPDSAAGLEMADTILWDAPDPGLIDGQQNEALLEWVRRGGRLILGVSKTWNSLASSRFGPVLPARLDGTKSTSDPAVLSHLLPTDNQGSPELPDQAPKLTYCPLTPASLAPNALAVLPRGPRDDEQIWVARRTCGRGEVILVPAEFQDVLPLNAQDKRLTFLRVSVLNLRSVPEARDGMRYFGAIDAFSRVAAQTAFQTTSGFYFAFAFAFVIAYIVVVTGGSWGWLRRRNGIRHAWVVFAALAAAASGVSLGAVQLVRALGQGVHEMTVVDGKAGSFDAVATSFLGLKTASHTLLDFCVPANWLKPADSPETRASIRPYAPDAGDARQNVFSVPQQYQAVAQIGELRAVPLRATLKQFEATWRGEMTGQIAASFQWRSPSSDELASSSWIQNRLGADLRDCYVFTRGSAAVLVYFIPRLGAGERTDWAAVCKAMQQRDSERRSRTRTLRERIDELTGDEKAEDFSPPLLRVLLAQCLEDLGIRSTRTSQEIARDQDVLADTGPPYVSSLLLLTFFDDPAMPQLMGQGQEIIRSHGRCLELSSRLDRQTALFVGFSEDPGPLRLCRRNPGDDVDAWRPVLPSRSAVMYRFTVPVQ